MDSLAFKAITVAAAAISVHYIFQWHFRHKNERRRQLSPPTQLPCTIDDTKATTLETEHNENKSPVVESGQQQPNLTPFIETKQEKEEEEEEEEELLSAVIAIASPITEEQKVEDGEHHQQHHHQQHHHQQHHHQQHHHQQQDESKQIPTSISLFSEFITQQEQQEEEEEGEESYYSHSLLPPPPPPPFAANIDGNSSMADQLGHFLQQQQQNHHSRSNTLHSQASDRRLPSVIEEEGYSSRESKDSFDGGVRLALKMDVIAGPCSETSYVTSESTDIVNIGRAPDNALILHDGEVSGHHVSVSWHSPTRCWKISDLGSLNGTLLNDQPLIVGEHYRLSADDILQLGTASRLKVSVLPREMLPENISDRYELSLGTSAPRSLTMPKHRIPSFTSLLSPKINSSPSKHAVVAAASDELRLECCIASATGRDHARRGQLNEDIAMAECPLHGAEASLDGMPVALFCIFDGHCGRRAAEAASIALPDELSDRFDATNKIDMEEGRGAFDALHDAFLATDDRIAEEEGCTATATLAWRGKENRVYVQTANVGDSAALLIDPETGSWQQITEDHRLSNPAERERLTRNGIPLSSDSRRLYGLNLARALGDRFLKDEDLGLIAEPHISDVISIPSHQGALLLLASDGLWDVLESEKVSSIASIADKQHDGSVLDVAREVVAAAKSAGTRDDVTVLVVRIWPEKDWELRSPTKNLDDGRSVVFEV